MFFHVKSSVISQKGQSQKGCFKKTKQCKFSEKKKISYPLISYQGVRNVRFWEIWRALFFLKHPF